MPWPSSLSKKNKASHIHKSTSSEQYKPLETSAASENSHLSQYENFSSSADTLNSKVQNSRRVKSRRWYSALLPSKPIPEQSSIAVGTKSEQLPASLSSAASQSVVNRVSPPTSPREHEQNESSETDRSKLEGRLWNKAYESIKSSNPDLVDKYERILSGQLHGHGYGESLTAEDLPENVIGQEPAERRRQMEALVKSGLARTEKANKFAQSAIQITDAIEAIKGIQLIEKIKKGLAVSPQAAVAWAAFSMLLEVIANPVQETAANRKGIEYVLLRMDWYADLAFLILEGEKTSGSKLFSLLGELEKRICELYIKLLSFQMKSVLSYSRSNWKELSRKFIKYDDWESALRDIKEAEIAIDKDIRMCDNRKIIEHFDALRDSLGSILRQLQNQNETMVRDKLINENRECLRSLNRGDPRDDKKRIELTKGGLHLASSSWIFQHDDFKKWRESHGEDKLLWIKGDPGKGKTMLLISIINELEKLSLSYESMRPSHSEITTVLYFFCEANSAGSNSSVGVLRGLIYMLCMQHPEFIAHVREKYDTTGASLFEGENAFIALSEIFEEMLRDERIKSIFIIIDALDECESGQSLFLEYISRISSEVKNVRWLVSSRNYREIERKLKCGTSLSLEHGDNAKSVAQGVKSYIDDMLSKVDLLREERLREKVRTALQQRASGTFLWVALVVQLLINEADKLNIDSVLEELPNDLNSLYERIIKRIKAVSGSYWEYCRRLLSFLVLTHRPLHLAEISVMGILPPEIAQDSEHEKICNLIERCASLLKIQDDTVYFVHLTAKDYLTGPAEPELFLNPSAKEDIHYEIVKEAVYSMEAALCRNIYNIQKFDTHIDDVKAPNPDPLEAVKYFVVYWLDHYSLCYGMEKDFSFLPSFFSERFLYWFEALSLLREVPTGTTSLRQLAGLPLEQSLLPLVRDSLRFILHNGSLVSRYPLQAYISALLFSPKRSLARIAFESEISWISPRPTVEDDWSPCLQTLEGHSDWVRTVAFSPGDQFMASGSTDRLIKIWDGVNPGVVLKTLKGHTRDVFCLAFSKDGQLLVSGSADKTIKVWNMVDPGTAVETLSGHTDAVLSVAFSPDGRYIASGSQDMTIKIWSTKRPAKVVRTLNGHSHYVNSVAFSPNGRYLVSASNDRTIKVWNAASRVLIKTFDGHTHRVSAVAFSHDSRYMASGSWDKTVKVWDMESMALVKTLRGHTGCVNAVAFWPESWHLASASADGSIKIWDTVGSGTVVKSLEGHTEWVRTVTFSLSGRHLASGSDDKTIKIWETTGPETILKQTEGHSDTIQSIAFSPNGRYMASGSDDKTVKVWDTADPESVVTLSGHTGRVCSVAFSPDGCYVASGSADKTIKVWDMAYPKTAIKTLKGHSDLVQSVIFSPNGQYIASGSNDRTIKIWDAVGSGEAIQTLKDHFGWVLSVAFSPDGRYIASGSTDKSVGIWDTKGELVKKFQRLSDKVTTVAFSSDGRYLESNLGSFELWSEPSASTKDIIPIRRLAVQRSSSGLSADESWVKWNGENLIRLPDIYKTSISVIPTPPSTLESSTRACVVLGCKSGWILQIGIPSSGPPLLTG